MILDSEKGRSTNLLGKIGDIRDDYSKIDVPLLPMEIYGNIFLTVNMISPNFPIFPSTLVPFLLILNHTI